MEKINRPWRTVVTIIVAIALVYILRLIDYEIRIGYSFNGVVEDVTYDWNLSPHVKIKGKEYALSYGGWHIKVNTIEVGDKLIKKKSEWDLLLIKHNSKDTINLLYKQTIKKSIFKLFD
jgi:uncharacterized lipoprotein YehR (DUF1307 family)